MRSEGFLFLSGGSGGGTVFISFFGMVPRAFAHVRARSRTFAHVRERSFCARCAVPLGLASKGVAWAELCGAVPWGLVGRAWFGWRCAVVIAGESLVWVALCRCDCLSGRRCAVVIAGESLVWVAPCRCDWWGELGLGGCVPL